MSDSSVANALRSSAKLVVIEAPAGCGKTFQGAEYASEIAGMIGSSRVLILAHTHAACDVFASRTRRSVGHVDIRTMDSLIAEIASVYHEALELPEDTGAWARNQENGYSQLAAKVVSLLRSSPMISRSLSLRYPILICDEHQDASADQHAIAMAFYRAGASVRIFGDPMQRIFGSRRKAEDRADNDRWESLKHEADVFDELDEPHRWPDCSRPLGIWILDVRAALRGGGQVDLSGRMPQGVGVVFAENLSAQARGGYRLTKDDARPLYDLEKETDSLLVLATQNETVKSLRAFFNRRLPIWEGHMRESLAKLADEVQKGTGDAYSVAQAVVKFLTVVATGFSPSAFGDTLLDEVRSGCVKKRNKKPAALQALGRIILEQPDHKGVSKLLNELFELTRTNPAFETVKLDHSREFWDAVHVGRFENLQEGFAEILHRRSYSRPSPPQKAISTVHKAKGLECPNVLIMPCDAEHYSDSPAARRRLYVAMSRATRSLTFVVSRQEPSPLFVVKA